MQDYSGVDLDLYKLSKDLEVDSREYMHSGISSYSLFKILRANFDTLFY